jgi:diketogulonate reductase-like aldo/keto reductase
MQDDTIQLNSGVHIPRVGFGTWHLTGETAQTAISTALSVGYRHIDTADRYGNHEDVAAALNNSEQMREDVFITTKLWFDTLSYDDVHAATERFLNELQTTYIDQLLIHWPNRDIPMQETLTAMQELTDTGKVRSLGVSNCTVNHIRDALETGVTIDVNQVEMHPTLNQTELKQFCDEHGIIITAYSPNGQGHDLQQPVIQELAQQYGRPPAQIVLSWLLAKGIVIIPRSSNPEHIEENFRAQEFLLTDEEVARIDAIEEQDNRLVVREFSDFEY